MNVLIDNGHLLAGALGTTLMLSVLGGLVALMIGLAVATARLCPVPLWRRAGAIYVEIIRNTPLTVVFFVVVFVLPQVGLNAPGFRSAAIFTLGVYTAAFVAEAVRAGVNTVGRGQAEAARALGLTFSASMRFIIVPQALRAVVAPLANTWIALVKNSSVAAGFGVLELTASGQRINFLDPGAVLTALGWIAAAYLVITLSSAYGFRRLEKVAAVAR